MKPLRELGKAIADLQDARAQGDDVLARARQGFLAAPLQAPSPSGKARLPWTLAAAAALVALGAALYAVWMRPPKALEFEVRDGLAAHTSSSPSWIAAPRERSLPIHFSDGSEVVFTASSRARVVEVKSYGARVILERGEGRASIVHREQSDWYFEAGPFDVHVTGTRFQMSWEPDEALFTLALEEGSVVVQGCGLDGARKITTGQSLRLTCEDERVARPAAPVAEPVAAIPAPSAAPSPKVPPAAPHRVVAEVKPLEPPAAESAPPLPSEPPAPVPPAWRTLLDAHRYPEAYAVAEREGWARLCEERDAAELSALADLARFTGHIDGAEQALRAIRRRFPSDEKATLAAFQLGRLAFDARARFHDAAGWFDVAYHERPQGPVAREALGRLMESRERAGEWDAAKEAAREYQRRYPFGVHAERAEGLLRR